MLRLSFMHSLNMVQDALALIRLRKFPINVCVYIYKCSAIDICNAVEFAETVCFSIRQGFSSFAECCCCSVQIYSCTSYYKNTFFCHIFCHRFSCFVSVYFLVVVIFVSFSSFERMCCWLPCFFFFCRVDAVNVVVAAAALTENSCVAKCVLFRIQYLRTFVNWTKRLKKRQSPRESEANWKWR